MPMMASVQNNSSDSYTDDEINAILQSQAFRNETYGADETYQAISPAAVSENLANRNDRFETPPSSPSGVGAGRSSLFPPSKGITKDHVFVKPFVPPPQRRKRGRVASPSPTPRKSSRGDSSHSTDLTATITSFTELESIGMCVASANLSYFAAVVGSQDTLQSLHF